MGGGRRETGGGGGSGKYGEKGRQNGGKMGDKRGGNGGGNGGQTGRKSGGKRGQMGKTRVEMGGKRGGGLAKRGPVGLGAGLVVYHQDLCRGHPSTAEGLPHAPPPPPAPLALQASYKTPKGKALNTWTQRQRRRTSARRWTPRRKWPWATSANQVPAPSCLRRGVLTPGGGPATRPPPPWALCRIVRHVRDGGPRQREARRVRENTASVCFWSGIS